MITQQRAVPVLRAFGIRNYRLYVAVQGLWLPGTRMQKTAVSWMMYAVTQSKLMPSVTVFATLFPSACLTPIGGIVSSRYKRFQVLLLIQVSSVEQAIG